MTSRQLHIVSNPPQVLFLTQHLPYPPVSGATRREYELITRLAQHVDIHLVVVSKNVDADADNISALTSYIASCETFPASASDNFADYGIAPQILRNTSAEARRYVAAKIRQGIDVAHCEGFYMHQLLPEPAPIPTVTGVPNVEHELFLDRSQLGGASDRAAMARAAVLTELAERRVWTLSDVCGFVSARDQRRAQAMEPSIRAVHLPNGVNHSPTFGTSAQDAAADTECDGIFVGNFHYYPNEDAAHYLVYDLLPAIVGHTPGFKLRIIGNGAETLNLSHPNVEVIGRVEDLRPYYQSSKFVLAPLRIGGGVKVKVVEAIAMGLPVLTSAIGAQDMDATDGLIVAETVGEFAAQAAALARVPRRHEKRHTSGISWDIAASRMLEAYTLALGDSR